MQKKSIAPGGLQPNSITTAENLRLIEAQYPTGAAKLRRGVLAESRAKAERELMPAFK